MKLKVCRALFIAFTTLGWITLGIFGTYVCMVHLWVEWPIKMWALAWTGWMFPITLLWRYTE